MSKPEFLNGFKLLPGHIAAWAFFGLSWRAGLVVFIAQVFAAEYGFQHCQLARERRAS